MEIHNPDRPVIISKLITNKLYIMVKLCFFSFFIISCFFVKAQSVFSFQIDSCLFEIKIKKNGERKNGKFLFEIESEIYNYSNTEKYFLKGIGDAALHIDFSDYYFSSKSISFFVGCCNEDRFPYLCKTDTFSLITLTEKGKINQKQIFESKYDIFRNLKRSELLFYFRFLKTSFMPAEKNKINIWDYNNLSVFTKVVLNQQNRKNKVTRLDE